MEVVAQRIGAREFLEIWRVALCHVEELHRGGTFVGGLVGESGGLRPAIVASANRRLDPREQIVAATAGIVRCCRRDAAVDLLPHLEEAMHRAVGVIVVADRRVHIDRRVRQVGREARVDDVVRQIGAAFGQLDVVGRRKRGFDGFRLCNGGQIRLGRRAPGVHRWQLCIRGGVHGRAGEIAGALGLPLAGKADPRTGCAIGSDDAFGQQIVHVLPCRRRVGREHVVERAVLADQQDDVLDRSQGDVAAIIGAATTRCDDSARPADRLAVGGSGYMLAEAGVGVWWSGSLCADHSGAAGGEQADDKRFQARNA
jgi:hypothetical protein